eukprot:TRINITY_DN16154_c0_g1_i1.p1 TRINITY_DN16154_c0_g1~~TRINITY_DN16154_c0_g1_i1.p1  ORF type:complete len:353 (+),score=70.94 TRINITY_DN16154_c0_g1_i1:184-1242(+)
MDTRTIPLSRCVEFGNDDLMLERFKQDGYVVVSGILQNDEIESVVDEIWTNPRLLGEDGVDRNDAETWKWNNEGSNHGFVDSPEQHSDEWCWKLRTNDRVLSVFTKILESENIVASTDRWGVLPPTKDILLKSTNETVQRPNWLTEERWLHWDQHPFLQRDQRKVQGLITLTEHTDDSGGFMCIPQFMKEFDTWSDNHTFDGKSSVPYMIDKSSPLNKRTQKILMPKGSLLVWDSRLPHQNFPNRSPNFRMVFYITFNKTSPEELEELKENNNTKLSAGFVGKYYPASVPSEKRRFLGLPQELPPPPSDGAIQAIELYNSAGAVEGEDPAAAASLYRKAFKLNPDLERAVCL